MCPCHAEGCLPPPCLLTHDSDASSLDIHTVLAVQKDQRSISICLVCFSMESPHRGCIESSASRGPPQKYELWPPGQLVVHGCTCPPFQTALRLTTFQVRDLRLTSWGSKPILKPDLMSCKVYAASFCQISVECVLPCLQLWWGDHLAHVLRDQLVLWAGFQTYLHLYGYW